MPGNATQDEQVRERIDDIDGFEPAVHPDGQALVGELVDDVEHAELASIVGAVLDEVVGPDMVAVFRPEPDARSIVQPQRPRLGCFCGTFSPSRRQIRSTRLSFTSQPARRSSAAILR